MSLWYLNEIVFHVLDYAFVTAAVTACTVRTTLRSPQDDLMLFAEFANKLFLVLFGPSYVSPPPLVSRTARLCAPVWRDKDIVVWAQQETQCHCVVRSQFPGAPEEVVPKFQGDGGATSTASDVQNIFMSVKNFILMTELKWNENFFLCFDYVN